MSQELLDLYRQGSDWAIGKIGAAADRLDAPTPCEGWDLRTLLNHMLQTQQFFIATGKGEKATPPFGEPPSLLGDDPKADFEAAQRELVAVYSNDGVPVQGVGIAFSDMLVHGCDVARATGQDDTMPDGLAQAAFDIVNGNLSAEARGQVFGPEVAVADDAPAQEKLLGYTGRQPRL